MYTQVGAALAFGSVTQAVPATTTHADHADNIILWRWKGQQVELNLKPLPVQCDEQEGGDSSGSNYPA